MLKFTTAQLEKEQVWLVWKSWLQSCTWINHKISGTIYGLICHVVFLLKFNNVLICKILEVKEGVLSFDHDCSWLCVGA